MAPTGDPYELRCVTPQATTLRIGPLRSRDEADARSLRARRAGHVVRCDLFKHVAGDWRLIGRIGQPQPPPPALAEPDEG